jgi:hypothetical protein
MRCAALPNGHGKRLLARPQGAKARLSTLRKRQKM